MTTFIDSFSKIALALIVGGLVGLERERRDLPAGVRTHMLVCAGSALFTVVAFFLTASRADASRIVAQIVTGIGFLGAGTIFRSGPSVRGLTTAAGLWLVAAVGMGIAAGGPALAVAVATALLVMGVNIGFPGLEERWIRPHHTLRLTLERGSDALARLAEGLARRGVLIQQVECITETADPETFQVRLVIHGPAAGSPSPAGGREELSLWIGQQPGVRQVVWE